MMKNILTRYTHCEEVPEKVVRMQEVLSENFDTKIQTRIKIWKRHLLKF